MRKNILHCRMPRTARVDIPDHWYHVISRGQRKESLFLDSKDKQVYLRILYSTTRRNRADISAYCLMTNHVHLLIYRRSVSLGTIFRQAHKEYAVYFNRRHGKVGYVFQGRYKSYLCLSERYLMALIPYIHLNPVKAGLVGSPSGYYWSTDSAYRKGKPKGDIKIRIAPGFEGKDGQVKYRELTGDCDVDLLPVFGQYIGSQGEERNVNRRKHGRDRWTRENRRDRIPVKARLDQLLKEKEITLDKLSNPSRIRKYAKIRQKLMSDLYEEGYSPSEIAPYFKRTHASVILAYKRLHVIQK